MMKLISLAFFLIISQFVSAQNETENLGLISQLVTIKYGAEQHLANSLTNIPEDKATMAKYNKVRMLLDQFVLQLGTDMKLKNSPKKFKMLDRYYKQHLIDEDGNLLLNSKVKPYALKLKEVVKAYTILIGSSNKSVTEIIVPAFGAGWTMFKDVKEMQGSKVDGIILFLDKVRLSLPSELLRK